MEVALPEEPRTLDAAEPRRVAVISHLRLLVEAVAAALAGTGHDVTRLPWPDPEAEPAIPVPREGDDRPPEVLVIVCEDADQAAVEGVRRAAGRYGGRCLVVSGARPGPLWGGFLDAGAAAVLPASTSIDELLEAVETLARGDEVTGIFERQVLLRRWFAQQAERDVNRSRIALLTPREREVLALLHEGCSTLTIAERLGVSPTTVRSQIRAILRKLGVRSQLAAVAVLASTLESAYDGS